MVAQRIDVVGITPVTALDLPKDWVPANVQTAKGADIELPYGVEGYIKAGDLSRDRVEDATKVLSVGATLEARFIGIDRKTRVVTLSVREKEIQEEQEVVAEYSRNASTGKTSLGDLLKDQLG